jgi:surface protein
MKTKIFTVLVMLFLFLSINAQMVLEYNTNISDGTTITLPLYGTVNVTVDWGDLSTPENITTEGDKDHTYASEGTYTVSITGSLTQFGFMFYANSDKLIRVSSFADLGLTSLGYAFYNAINLIEVPTSIPATVTDLHGMFYGASVFNQDISLWDVSHITNMYSMFNGASSFNQNIGNWDVTNVTNMLYMFYNSIFNQNIGNWNVGNVTNMNGMFGSCSVFNQDIGSWDVSKVTSMDWMFSGALAFNQDISNWNVGNVLSMRDMFSNTIFNQDIGSWDVSKVTDMNFMFFEASAFNQDIGNWDVGNVLTMREMFYNTIFNQDIGNWNVSKVTEMGSMFSNSAFNQDIGNWNVGNVNYMAGMFSQSVFNQDIGSWDVGNVTNMNGMFQESAFNQDIGSWNIGNVTQMFAMFDRTTLSVINYNAILSGWASQAVQQNVTFYGGDSQYSCSSDRDVLTNAPNNWTIIDDGPIIDNTAPVITSKHFDQSLDAGENCETLLPDYTGDIVATDNYDTYLDITQDPVSGTTISGVTNQVTLTATDCSGNTAEVSFNVVIEDNTAPEITCVADQIVNAGASQTYTVVGTEFDPTAEPDNCGPASLKNDFNQTASLADAQIPRGTTTVVWTITDDAGNENTCTYDITVNAPVNIETWQENGISIYPNPTSGSIQINNKQLAITNVKISDILGRRIIEKSNIQQNEVIDLSSLESGIYIISIQIDKETFATKIVKK